MKTYSIILTFLALSFGSFSQGESHVVDLRAYGGLTILQLSSDNVTSIVDGIIYDREVSGRPGFQAGVSFTYGNRFFLQPGFQWSRIGTEIVNTSTVDGSEFVDQTSLNVVSVPLKVGVRLMDPRTENLLNLRLFGGFDGHHVTSVTYSNKSGIFDEIDTDDYSNLIVNADFGMGLDILFFFVDLGYQIGLTPVYGKGDDSSANSFYANLGLKLTFGK